ncbi:unnamed protein product, partial [Allacma fusca]
KAEIRGSYLNGFTQHISVIPFVVVLFCQKQLDYLWHISKDNDVVLFFDGTGTLCQKLPKPFEQKAIQYYAMVAKPRIGVEAVPVLEFYTGRQDVETIEMCLRAFFYSYKKYFEIRGRAYRVARVEIDFSKALLAAVISVYQGLDTEGYIRTLWNSMNAEGQIGRPFSA